MTLLARAYAARGVSARSGRLMGRLAAIAAMCWCVATLGSNLVLAQTRPLFSSAKLRPVFIDPLPGKASSVLSTSTTNVGENSPCFPPRLRPRPTRRVSGAGLSRILVSSWPRAREDCWTSHARSGSCCPWRRSRI